MTVPVQTPFQSSVANGVTTVFPYGFMIASANDLAVTLDGVLQTSGFTVSGVGNPAGGNVTFSVAPANGVSVVRYLSPVLRRETDYQQFGDWLATVVNLDFDRLWLAVQAVWQRLSRTMRLSDYDTSGADLTLPTPSPLKFWRWNATATELESVDVVGQGSIGLPITVDQGGTNATTAAGARTNLGLGTGAVKDSGTAAGNLVALDGTGKLPSVDGSQLTGMSGTGLKKNYLINGSFAICQRTQSFSMPTTDNAYTIDRWRLLLGTASAATIAQDTADVPVGAGYAAKLTVGAANNNKFGIFQPIENANILDLRGNVCSVRVPLKATAGLTDGTGKIRIGILQWTGTADSISGSPISAWGAEGTNPTLAAGWTFINTPAAISVLTSWADYVVENIPVSASATNLGVLIWSDDKTNTTTTDILRVGGYVTMNSGATATGGIVPSVQAELLACYRYCEINISSEQDFVCGLSATSGRKGKSTKYSVKKRVAAPSPVIYDRSVNVQRVTTLAADGTPTDNVTASAIVSGVDGLSVYIDASTVAGLQYGWKVDAEL